VTSPGADPIEAFYDRHPDPPPVADPRLLAQQSATRVELGSPIT